MVDEILTYIRTAFNASYEEKRINGCKDSCSICPLNIFGSLCQELESLSTEQTKKYLQEWTDIHMFEREKKELFKRQTVIMAYHRSLNLTDLESEVTVSLIRHLCTKSQASHIHKFDQNFKNHKINFKGFSIPDLFKKIGRNDIFGDNDKTCNHDTIHHFTNASNISNNDNTYANLKANSIKVLPLCNPSPSGYVKSVSVPELTTDKMSWVSSKGLAICEPQELIKLPDNSSFASYCHRGLNTNQLDHTQPATRKDSKSRSGTSSANRDTIDTTSTSSMGQNSPTLKSDKIILKQDGIYNRHKDRSWRHKIFHKIVIPCRFWHRDLLGLKTLSGFSTPEERESYENNGHHQFTSQDYKVLWKKAISDIISLNRMEKENNKLRNKRNLMWMRSGKFDFSFHRLDDVVLPEKEMLKMEERMAKKLNYQEVIPCSDIIMAEWENILKAIRDLKILVPSPLPDDKILTCKTVEEIEQVCKETKIQIDIIKKHCDQITSFIYKGVAKIIRGKIWLTLTKLKVYLSELNQFQQKIYENYTKNLIKKCKILIVKEDKAEVEKENENFCNEPSSNATLKPKLEMSNFVPKVSQILHHTQSGFATLNKNCNLEDVELFDKQEVCPILCHRLSKKASTLTYDELLTKFTPYQHSILIDIGRSFPTHPYFEKSFGEGQLSLYNLLKAYSLIDPQVGYCQGLSYVAGILLMHMEEEEACEVLKYLMINLNFREHYTPDMLALQRNLYSLSRLIKDVLPDLYDHFDFHNVYISLYAPSWFLTLFASDFPLNFVVHVYDYVFVDGGSLAIFKAAIILLYQNKEKIIELDSMEDIANYLKNKFKIFTIENMQAFLVEMECLDIREKLKVYEIEYSLLKEDCHNKKTGQKHKKYTKASENVNSKKVIKPARPV